MKHSSRVLLARLGEGTGVISEEGSLGKLIPNLFNIAVTLGAFFVMYQLILGALGWINSAGDKEKISKAQKQMTNALIGLVILVSIWILFFTIAGDILGIFEGSSEEGFRLVLPSLFGD